MLLLIFTSSAWSLSVGIGSINVGSVDTLLYSAVLCNSGDATELAWVQSLLGSDITLTEKTDTTESSWLQTNENARVYAYDFVTVNPEYFLVKTGNLKLSTENFDTFLFKNVSELSWGVIDLDLSDIIEIKNVGKLSHIDEFNGGTPVPEPATMLLVAIGLIGLAGFGRKKFSN